MDDEVAGVAAAGPDDGTGAVLYGMFTSFTEVLGGLEGRLVAIEEAVRRGPPDLELRLAALEASLDELSGVLREVADAAAAAPATTGWADDAARDARVAAGGERGGHSDLLERRTAELAAAVEAVRALVQAHMDDTAHSLGRRAGEAGRRLASDLGLRGRPKQPPEVGS